MIGHPIHRNAAAVLEKLGGDASDFVARQLTSKIANGADLIITMTGAHRDLVLEVAPRQLQRTFNMTEAARLASMDGAASLADLGRLRPHLGTKERPDVPDPIGQSLDIFLTVGSQIARLLPPILEACRRSTADDPRAHN